MHSIVRTQKILTFMSLTGECWQQKHTQNAPSTKTVCDYLYGWIKKRSHTQKSHQNGEPQIHSWELRRINRSAHMLQITLQQNQIHYIHFLSTIPSSIPQISTAAKQTYKIQLPCNWCDYKIFLIFPSQKTIFQYFHDFSTPSCPLQILQKSQSCSSKLLAHKKNTKLK